MDYRVGGRIKEDNNRMEQRGPLNIWIRPTLIPL